jgi:protoporphyrinogen IX oxidase
MNTYLLLKALHIVSMTAWMAGMFYLPRLFAYHAEAAPGSEIAATFKIMERRLLRIIMNPAMLATFGFGIAMILVDPTLLKQGWLHAKIAVVLGMAGLHGYLSACRKRFEQDANTKSGKFYRVLNEVPTVLLLVIVLLAVLKPM